MERRAEYQVEVVYATPERAFVRVLTLPAGSRVLDALRASGVEETAGIRVDSMAVGIFGEPVTLDARLNDGDRVEIYRPLTTDPKVARRRRVKPVKR